MVGPASARVLARGRGRGGAGCWALPSGRSSASRRLGRVRCHGDVGGGGRRWWQLRRWWQ
eukprot:5835548-Pyramimonas_sp.AAC.1